jgi:DNA-binding SARP family transcriptional activator
MFDRRKALTLLKILLIHDGHPVRGETLAELLWPEADPKTAMNRLYVLVHTLRRVVEPSTQDQRWVFICSDGGRYYFNSEAPYRLDVREFREYVSLGERLERDGDVTAASHAYEAAVNRYRGNLLEDEPYADWCGEQREHLREQCLAVLGKLATYHLQQDAPEKSVERCRQALRIDPLREGNHRQLMRALWVAGRRDEALREYRVCKDLLRRELDVDPLSETEELYSLIRNDRER